MPFFAAATAWGQRVTLWSENFSGFSDIDALSGQITNDHAGTSVYGGAMLSYNCSDDVELSNGTLYIPKFSSFWAYDIPTAGAAELQLTFSSNSNDMEVSTSSTSGVVISEPTKTGSNSYKYSFTITTNGASTIRLVFRNCHSPGAAGSMKKSLDNIALTYLPADGNGYCGASGHEADVTWAYSSSTRTLAISGTGDMANYSNGSSTPWNDYKSSIECVVVGNGVTGIGNYAFYNCSNLATVTLDGNPYISDSAFNGTSATVTMYLTANPAEGAYWTTFFNRNYSFQADGNTQVFKATLNGTTLSLNEVADGIVDANTAVILKSTGNPVMTMSTGSSSDSQANSLIGVSAATTNPGNAYVLSYKPASGVGFYKLKSTGTIGVGKAYLPYVGGTSSPEFFNFADDATGVGAIVGEGPEARQPMTCYDLTGRKVAQPSRGIYVVDGKKVFIP